MTIKERICANQVILLLAMQNGKSPAEIRKAMQECLDEAWINKTSASAAAWIRYFPDGRKPSLEKFMYRLVKEIKTSL